MTYELTCFQTLSSSQLAPWFYIQIQAPTLVGFTIASEILDWSMLIGAGFIFTGGLCK